MQRGKDRTGSRPLLFGCLAAASLGVETGPVAINVGNTESSHAARAELPFYLPFQGFLGAIRGLAPGFLAALSGPHLARSGSRKSPHSRLVPAGHRVSVVAGQHPQAWEATCDR